MTPEAEANAKAKAERIAIIEKAIGNIVEAATRDDGKGPILDGDASVIHSAATLAYCGLVALTEIADAQQRMAALAERDFDAEVKSASKQQAEVEADKIVKDRGKRNFLGMNADRS